MNRFAPRCTCRSPAPAVAAAVVPLFLLSHAACATPLFAAPFLSFDVGASPTAVALGDVNTDGKPDLVVANASATTVSVLLGTGDGTFGAKTDFAT